MRRNYSRVSGGLKFWPFVGKFFGTEKLSSLRFVKSSAITVMQKAVEHNNLQNMVPISENMTTRENYMYAYK